MRTVKYVFNAFSNRKYPKTALMLTKAIAGEAVNYKVNTGKYSGIQLKKQWEKYLNSKSKKCQVEIMGQQVNQKIGRAHV